MADPDTMAGELSDVTRQARARADRAVKAAVAVATAHGLRVDAPVVLASAYAVRVHLAPAPVVARVPTLTAWVRKPIEPWLERELAVVSYLASRSAPVVPPSAELPPGPHVHDGLAMTFWQHVETIPGRTVTTAETVRMLGELHAVLRDYPGELPLLAPPLNDIPACLDMLDRARDSAGALAPGDLDLLHAAWEHVSPRLHTLAGPLQPVHGDAHAGNVLATPHGLLWNDFEDVSLGPVAWDLTSLVNSGENDLSGYPDAPDTAMMELCHDARMLQVACWLAALPPVFDGQDRFIEDMLAHWRTRRW